NDGLLRTQLFDHLRQYSVHQPDVAVIETRLNAGYSGCADNLFRMSNLYARQSRRTQKQRLGRYLYARRNHASQIVAFRRYRVESSGGSEIDHNARAA